MTNRNSTGINNKYVQQKENTDKSEENKNKTVIR